MKVLLTGATGYIGKRLLPILVQNGHHVVCAVRDSTRFNPPKALKEKIVVIEIDLLDERSLTSVPDDIEAAYYLVHSMSASQNYAELEQQSTTNFRARIDQTNCNHVIYLSGIVNDDELSEHLQSRKAVEEELAKEKYNFTCLRAGIIVGSGSASFEIIRDLVEKLPIMVAPKWIETKCQPIAIRDVLTILSKSLGNEKLYNQNFDIGGHDVLSYKDMLLKFAEVRGLKRTIISVPVMTPKLSSYWLYFVTSTSFKLACSLVDSMKVEVICEDDRINRILDIKPLSYRQALVKAFVKVESNAISSSWKDSYTSSGLNSNISDFIQVPQYGCFRDYRHKTIKSKSKTIQNIWRIGGDHGWYYGTWLWKIRGYLDKVFGGVGLRRGRTSQTDITPGDALDFWRVLHADKSNGHLLLFAEMKLPGEAWLEFKIDEDQLHLNATFRPLGILGRLYWYAVYPFHGFIFDGLLNALINFDASKQLNVMPQS